MKKNVIRILVFCVMLASLYTAISLAVGANPVVSVFPETEAADFNGYTRAVGLASEKPYAFLQSGSRFVSPFLNAAGTKLRNLHPENTGINLYNENVTVSDYLLCWIIENYDGSENDTGVYAIKTKIGDSYKYLDFSQEYSGSENRSIHYVDNPVETHIYQKSNGTYSFFQYNSSQNRYQCLQPAGATYNDYTALEGSSSVNWNDTWFKLTQVNIAINNFPEETGAIFSAPYCGITNSVVSQKGYSTSGLDANRETALNQIYWSNNYCDNSSLKVWNFEKVEGTDTLYYLTTQVGGEKKYLRLFPDEKKGSYSGYGTLKSDPKDADMFFGVWDPSNTNEFRLFALRPDYTETFLVLNHYGGSSDSNAVFSGYESGGVGNIDTRFRFITGDYPTLDLENGKYALFNKNRYIVRTQMVDSTTNRLKTENDSYLNAMYNYDLISDTSLLEWTVELTPGGLYLKANDTGKYLCFNEADGSCSFRDDPILTYYYTLDDRHYLIQKDSEGNIYVLSLKSTKNGSDLSTYAGINWGTDLNSLLKNTDSAYSNIMLRNNTLKTVEGEKVDAIISLYNYAGPYTAEHLTGIKDGAENAVSISESELYKNGFRFFSGESQVGVDGLLNSGSDGYVASTSMNEQRVPNMTLNGKEYSWLPLFSEAGSESSVAWESYTMFDGGGLFRQDEEGYYYFDSGKTAAVYDKESNSFILYENTVAPGYAADRTSFFPFNEIEGKSYPDSKTRVALKENKSDWTTVTDLWFGMSVAFNFYQTKDGQLNGNDMIFEFTGDDDVLVYIDDVLVINLSGCHGAITGWVNFATGQVYSDSNWTTLKALFGLTGTTFEERTEHSFKMFYMERGGNISNCSMKLNLNPSCYGNLVVENEIDEPVISAAVQALEMEYTLTSNNKFETAEWTPVTNVTYWVRDSKDTSQIKRTGKTDLSGKFTLHPGEEAYFEVPGDKNYIIVENEAAAANVIAPLKQYQIENETAVSSQETPAKVQILNTDFKRVTYTHTLPHYHLTISKTLKNRLAASFEFSATISNGTQNWIPAQSITGASVDEDGVISFTLEITSSEKHPSVTLDVPYGMNVNIEEKDSEEYRTMISVNGDPATESKSCTVSNVQADGTVNVENTFKKENQLIISKVFVGLSVEELDALAEDFKITLTNTDQTGLDPAVITLTDELVSRDPATGLSSGRVTYSWIIDRIGTGNNYCVTESGYEVSQYDFAMTVNGEEASGGSVEIELPEPAAGESSTIDITNTYTLSVMDLTIQKAAKNPITDKWDDGQMFVFEITGADTATAGFKTTVTIRGTGSVTVNGLLIGKYRVTEVSSWSNRYNVTGISRSNGASLDANEPESAYAELTLSSVGADNVLTFTNELKDNKWLYSESLKAWINVFGKTAAKKGGEG